MFLAKISKGRTVKQFLLWSIVAPTIYTFVWPILYGGVGLRLERESSEIGLCCKEDGGNSGWFHDVTKLAQMTAEKNLMNSTPTLEDASDFSWMCEGGNCSNCAISTITLRGQSNNTFKDIIEEYAYLKHDFGSTTADRRLSRLSCHELVQMWFDIMRSVPGLGTFLPIFSLVAIVIYFVTTSDSGSLVIDSLAANGDSHSSPIQRAFWATMEGATATALLTSGGTASLTALQTMGIVSAFPNSVVICLLCVSTWRALKVANGVVEPDGPKFAFRLFEPLAAGPYKR